jgi:dTDP-4-dehydrorhamnose reductase
VILVVGAQGMLGQDLMDIFGSSARGVDLAEVDITDMESVRRLLLTLKPEVVVNAAAYTDVDGCQVNVEQAMAVNGEGVAHLAMVAAEIGSRLVQVSTDYVFDGSKGSPYDEDDYQHPMSVYGESKYAGELNARISPQHLIVRTQWLFGQGGKNFVETMLRLATERSVIDVVDDQVGSPTWTADLARAIKALLDKGCQGVYHAASGGVCSWNEFARAIFAEEGLAVTVSALSTEDLGRPAPRPRYSVLDCSRLTRDTGFVMPPWQEALRGYLALRRR